MSGLSTPWYITWTVVVLCCYGALCFYANRLVYYPLKYPQGFWDQQAQLNAEDVWIRTADGVRVHAWWVSQKGARFVTLYLHGNAGNVTHRGSRIREITTAGSSVLMLDYRGYGKSMGRPTERGLYADAQAAYEYLVRMGYRLEQIVVHGESIGCAVAIDVASRNACGGVVLEAPFTSAADVAQTVLPVVGPLLIRGFNSARKISRVRAPLLFIQGDRDEIIPLSLGQRLFAAAPAPKTFWLVEGAHHNDILETAGPQFRQRLQGFYQSLHASTGDQVE